MASPKDFKEVLKKIPIKAEVNVVMEDAEENEELTEVVEAAKEDPEIAKVLAIKLVEA